MDLQVQTIQGATDLDEEREQQQVSSLFYSMGEKAEDILQSFRLTENERKSHTTVRNKFQSFFVNRRNIVYERCRFKRECAVYNCQLFAPNGSMGKERSHSQRMRIKGSVPGTTQRQKEYGGSKIQTWTHM